MSAPGGAANGGLTPGHGAHGNMSLACILSRTDEAPARGASDRLRRVKKRSLVPQAGAVLFWIVFQRRYQYAGASVK